MQAQGRQGIYRGRRRSTGRECEDVKSVKPEDGSEVNTVHGKGHLAWNFLNQDSRIMKVGSVEKQSPPGLARGVFLGQPDVSKFLIVRPDLKGMFCPNQCRHSSQAALTNSSSLFSMS